MEKLSFWLMVGIVSIISIWAFKLIASQTQNEGLQSFAQNL